jgi:hypothetical protein
MCVRVRGAQAKISGFYELRQKGVRFNDSLLKNKAFRNPHIYAKLVEFVELDEIGSNLDKSVFDPHGFPREAYADKLGNENATRKLCAAEAVRRSCPLPSHSTWGIARRRQLC